MSDVPLKKMPLSDTRSRKDLLANVIQALSGEPLTKLCPCSTLSEKDLLYNIVIAAQQPDQPFPLRRIPLSDARSRKDLEFNIIEAFLDVPITRRCGCSTLSEKDLLYNIVIAARREDLQIAHLEGLCPCTSVSEKDLLYNLVNATSAIPSSGPTYLRPGAVFTYWRPGGTFIYLRP